MMKTVRLVEPGCPLEQQAVPVPEIGPRDVLVRVKAAGICTDGDSFLCNRFYLVGEPNSGC
ncbi:MAG: hypothetical protein ABSH34_07305 [Verrucomicrobiota bacterium]|jgi:D-arabinose 1-dehydrogenase-like Zn-dependent alcohol dehydrogenase